MLGTVWPIAPTRMVITLPVVAWIMIGFFETLPQELEEAALTAARPATPRAGRAPAA